MKITIVSCSLHPQSRSYILAQQAAAELTRLEIESEIYDLRHYTLPLCDAGPAYDAPEVEMLETAIKEAAAVLVAVPVYNFDVNAAAKNMVELTDKAWVDKVVGFMCAAGGKSSYMSVMGLANSLMLDFRSLIVPRFVYATSDDFGDDRLESMHIASDAVKDRVQELVERAVRLGQAVKIAAQNE